MVSIAVVGGTGHLGKGIARRLAKAGHQVTIGSRAAEAGTYPGNGFSTSTGYHLNRGNGDGRTLTPRPLRCDRTGDTVASLEYALPEPIVPPENDPTPFADAEDFDFGLFLANVASDPGRRDRIYREVDRAG